MEWRCTSAALADLEKLLTCGLCDNILSDPCTLGNCDHNFCRECIEKQLGSDSKCPDCGAFSWLKDIRINHQLSTTVNMTLKLSLLIHSGKKENMICNAVVNEPGNTIACGSLEAKPTTSRNKKDNTSLTKHVVVVEGKKKMKGDTVPKNVKKCEPVKKYSLRRNLKRQASCLINSGVIESEVADGYENSLSNTSVNEVKSAEKRRRKSNDDDIHATKSMNDGALTETAKNKTNFTSIRRKLRGFTDLSEDENGKKENNHEAIFDKTVNNHTEKESLMLKDKENVTLNVKRRKPRRKNTGIKQYLVEINDLDSSPEIKALSGSHEITKPRANMNVSLSQDSRNKRGETPLHLAAIKGDAFLALDLIKAGANPNAKDNAGWTPLHEACNHGHVDVVELFLDHGALLNIPGFDNDTPLHDAVANHRLNVVKLLVKRGASLTTRNKQGLVPMDYAVTPAMKKALYFRGRNQSEKKNVPSLDSITKIVENSIVSKVVLGTALNEREKDALKKCVPRLGGSLVNEFTESVTHVVTSASEDGICPRTIKYLSGVITGKWIVSFKWISDCVKSKKWIGEDDYEVCGTARKLSSGPKKARINMIQQLPPLFEGCSFFLRGSFNPPTPNKKDLLHLIKLGGGTILHREPKMKDDDLTSLPSTAIVTSLAGTPEVAYHARANSSLSCCTQFIIYDPTAYKNPKIIYSPVLCTAPVTWLMDCISSFELLDIPNDPC